LTILTNKKLNNTRNMFIVSLAVSDFMVSSVVMPQSISGDSIFPNKHIVMFNIDRNLNFSQISGVLLGYQWFRDRAVVCTILAVVCAPGCMASIYSIAGIAVSRCLNNIPTFVPSSKVLF